MTHYDPREHGMDEDKELDPPNYRLKIILILLFLAFWVLSIWAISEAVGGERIRLYETDRGIPKYTGYAEKQPNGDYRFYDKYGLYEGRMDKDRFYSKDGEVLEKYYLFPRR